MSAWATVTWDAARASGFTAYMLLSVAVVFGLLLSLRWQSKRWPRLITNDMHNHLALLAMAFGVVHGLASLLDPFMKFRVSELLVPFASHYRPEWMAFGIVSFYLGVAVLLSTWLRPKIGYKVWRALHGVTFLFFAFATVHGIGTGSDTRTPWAMAIYGAATAAVLGLTTYRLLLPKGAKARPRPMVAGLGAFAAAAIGIWAFGGPLQPGWNRVANNNNGSGARIALAATTSSVKAAAAAPLPASFTSTFSGKLTSKSTVQGAQAIIRGNLTGATKGDLQVLLLGAALPDGTIQVLKSQVTLYRSDGTAAYQGALTNAQGQVLVADVKPVSGSGQSLSVQLQWALNGSAVRGTVTTTPLSASSAPRVGERRDDGH